MARESRLSGTKPEQRQRTAPSGPRGEPGPRAGDAGIAAGDREIDKLRERARELAEPADQGSRPDDAVTFLEFMLNGECYGFELEHVREVHSLRRVTRLPGTPDYVLGIANVRGEIVAVVHLPALFGASTHPGPEEENRLILLADSEMEFGVHAGRILGVRTVSLQELQHCLTAQTESGQKYVRGITAGGTCVLDGGAMLADSGLVMRQAPQDRSL